MTPTRGSSILFITYNGLLEPIAQAQALSYLRRLAAAGYRIAILSFEKPLDLHHLGRLALRRRRDELAALGIRWSWLRYHKRPSVPATLFDVVCGIVVGAALALRYRCHLVHARGTVAAAMGGTVAALLRRKFLFDLRGLMAEEYADGGLWARESWRFRQVNRLERRLLERADGVVVLTQRIHDHLSRNGWVREPRPPMSVIPCCVDLERFRPRPKDAELEAQLGLSGMFVVLYVGSVGTWYLLEEMLDWFAAFRVLRPQSRFLIVTQTDPAPVLASADARGLAEAVVVTSAPQSEMGRYWSLGDAAISFIRPVFSKSASSPTKVGEALACGVPLILNRGVGDLDAFVERYRCGVLVGEFTAGSYAASVDQLAALLEDGDVRRRCRLAAEEVLALSSGAERYDRIYQELLGHPS
jgi:glycosyltransferase involved in cell wall biosynthesis